MNSPLARPLPAEMADRSDAMPTSRLAQALPDHAVGQLRPSAESATDRRDAAAPASVPATKVDIRSVNFFYGNFRALHNISVPLYDRRVTAFIGPSGCGKSTLLRILNRIYELYPGQVATGEVLLDGTDILAPGIDLNWLRAKVGMVFQKPTQHRLRHSAL
jgi:phosphate transport system ATP-binding protein